MAFWDDILKSNNKEKTRAEKLLDYFKAHKGLKDSENYIEILTKVVNGDGLPEYIPEEDLCRIISEICSKEKDSEMLGAARTFYDLIVYDPKDREQLELFHKFFKLFLSNQNIFKDMVSFEAIYSIFNNKQLVLNLYSYLITNNFQGEKTELLRNYIREDRQYYVDEEAFLSVITRLIDELNYYSYKTTKMHAAIEEFRKADKLAAGIYDIDTDGIWRLAKDVENMKEDINYIKAVNKDVKEKSQNMEQIVTSKTNEFVRNQTSDFSKLAKTYLEELKNTIIKLENLKKTSTSHLEGLGEHYIKKIQELLNIYPEKEEEIKAGLNKKISKDTYSEILDEKYTLKEKRRLVKEKMESTGESYHETFDRIFKFVLLRKPVMLVGPSGSGKTYTVEQIARLLDLPLYNFGFIADEFASIKGYNDANGNFVKTPFYDCLKYGGICFYDEADNSEAKAFMEINKVVGSNGYNSYLFPNGEVVKPHPNFLIIAASNTWGDGADTLHSTREKLDGASLNRFERIYYDYDKDLEKNILASYEDIYEFAIAYRNAVNERNFDKIVSTRDLSDIRNYLDSGEFSYDEIIQGKFVYGIRRDSLESILKDIEYSIDHSNKALKTFKSIIKGVKVKVK